MPDADTGGNAAEAHNATDMTQDVRFAVAMSGGVSLAVWMGGIAREINLLQQASNLRMKESLNNSGRGPSQASDGGAPAPTADGQAQPPAADGQAQPPAADGQAQPPAADGQAQPPARPSSAGTPDWDAQSRDLYLRLLRLLDVKVTVDVLSGTSAGGINAALLGLSSAAGVDLAKLRDLWLDAGSMDTLLRDPGEPNPPSLMQGDKVLFSKLAQGIITLYQNGRDQKLAPSTPAVDTPAVDTTVFITTTMMSGETSRFTDDYGTLVPDVDHHGLFTFGQDALTPREDETSLTALALAARSSASFPGAFEPSFVPINSQIAAGKGIPERPDMARFANMTRSHWVADGGLLANRPLTPLLAQVFAQPAWGQVRRVLAFVVPDGGGTPSPAAQPDADKWGQPPTLAGALKEDVGAQLAQSIASDLQAVRTHNERLMTGHNRRRYLAEMGSRPLDGGGLVTGVLLGDYEQQQGAGLAQPLLDEMMRQLTTMALPDAWATELSAGAEPPETRMATSMAAVLGGGWQAGPETGAWTAWQAAADPFDRAAAFGLPVFHAARATVIHLLKLGYQQATDPGQRAKITGYRAAIENTYPAPSPAWGERGEVGQKLTEAAKASPVPDLMTVAHELADTKRQSLLIGPGTPATAGEPKAAWVKLVNATIPLLGYLDGLAAPNGRSSRQEAADAIGTYLGYLGSAPTPTDLADRLLSLVIAERALEPAEPEVDQPVEFIQVSANTRTLLAPRNELDTVNKLRGEELHHFAAFYKGSWRAYDWMWGRLDGSGWLVHILLDPRRILAVIEDHYQWPHGTRAEKFASLLRENTGLADHLEGDCLAKDLAFLDDPNAVIPVSLPNSALFLAQAWQNLIAANELPTVAEQILADSGRLPPLIDPRKPPVTADNAADGQPRPPASARVRTAWHKRTSKHRQNQPLNGPPDVWATDMLNMKSANKKPAAFARELPSCPVRQETLAGQVHTPAFARLATKAAAVATAAVSSAPETPGAVRPVLASARTVTRTGYMATKVTGGSGWKTLLAGVALAVIGGVLATQGLVVVGVTGTIVALVGLYLIALGAWGIHRGLLGALIAITALALAGSLTLAWVRSKIWGGTGLVPKHVLPWLQSTWWGGLALIGGVLLLAALISVLTRRRPRRNRGTEAAPAATAGNTQGPSGGQAGQKPSSPDKLPEDSGVVAGARQP
jgi:patatin-related protein